jgi:transcriptional regulator with XRE-family HTH domain
VIVAESDREPPAASLGEIIRRQRELAALPMRQLAQMVGISNPYLSQIERGLRAPSEHVLEAIAQSLRTSTEMLVAAAARRPADDQDGEGGEAAVLAAIRDDPLLTASQRQALAETYRAFTEVTAARRRRRGRHTTGPTPPEDATEAPPDSGRPAPPE